MTTPSPPPTTDQVLALLASFQNEYITAIKEGKDANDIITTKPSIGDVSSQTSTSTPPAPSPELYAINKLLSLGRKSSFPASLLQDPPAFRAILKTKFEPLCGRRVVVPKRADVLEKARGVAGYWIAWPGVDTSDNAPTIIYFHGRGMVGGEALYLFGFIDRLSQITGLRVLAVEYRLCPEHTPMEAVADGVAAYHHVIEDLKVPHKQVFLAGESGGGQMTLLVAQAISRQGLKSPAAAWAMSPVCTADDDDDRKYRGPTFRRDSCHFFTDSDFMYVIERVNRRVGHPDEIAGKNPQVSPLYAPVLNVCPLYFTVGDTEIFVNEVIAMYHKVRESGVATHLSVSPHGPHAYPALNTPESVAAIATAFAWMKQYSSL